MDEPKGAENENPATSQEPHATECFNEDEENDHHNPYDMGLSTAAVPGTHDAGLNTTDMGDDLAEIDSLQEKIDAMDAEYNKCQEAEDEELDAESDEVERRSVYVGNVDYGAKPQELQENFKACGRINRVTIMVDKFTGHPKGFAYIEFTDVESLSRALLLSDTLFRGRQIKVTAKRKNIPGYARGRGATRSRGTRPFRGRRAHYIPPRGYRPYHRGRGTRPHGPYE